MENTFRKIISASTDAINLLLKCFLRVTNYIKHIPVKTHDRDT